MRLALAFGIAAIAGAAQAAGPADVREVTLWGRTWTIVEVADKPGTFAAKQDNNGNNPFVRPSIRKSVQAKRALESATGCRVVWSTMTKNINDTFFAPVSCPPS